MFRKIAVVYQDHSESIHAYNKALEMATLLSVPLTVLTIAERLPAYTAYSAAADPSAARILEQDREQFYEQLSLRIVEQGRAAGVDVTSYILSGDAVEGIESFVKDHSVDLLILGLHKRTLRISSLWSSVYTLAQDLPCSLLGVH